MNTAPAPASGRPHRWRPSLPKRRSHRWLMALAVLMGVLLIVVILFDWNWLKGPVERAVEARTGRAFHIDGNLDVDLGRTITVRGDSLRLANASWSSHAQMAQADRAEIDLRFWPLLRGQVTVPEIRLTRPDLRLESAPKAGEPGNWAFPSSTSGGGRPMQLQRLLIDDGRLQFSDEAGKTDILVALNSARTAPAGTAPALLIAGKGRWKGNPFTLKGNTETPLELSNSDHPFRIHLDGRAGPTHAIATGTLTNPLQLRQLDLRLQLSGQDMEDLYPLIGIAIPSTPPYQLDGQLQRDGEVWRYQNFNGRTGDSDLAGNVQIDVGGERPFLRAELSSKRLDFDDLAGFVGAPPSTGNGESANAEQKAEAAALAAKAKLLPSKPYDLAKLRAMDADVRWKAARIDAPSLPLDDMDAHLKLNAGVLQLDPLNFGVAGGDIRSTIRMDARRDVISTKLQASVRRVQLGQLFADAKLAEQATGGISGEIDIAGSGNSVAAMLGSADGNIAVGMGRGHVGNLVMELAGLDVAESLKFLFTGDRQIPLRCAFGDFAVKQGVMQSRALAVDTTDTLIIGEGQISLKDETMDLLLRPRPKDISILALRSPLRIGGSFKDPSFRPDFKALGLRGVIAVALGSIAPPAALLATFEPGPGKDSDCGGKYAR